MSAAALNWIDWWTSVCEYSSLPLQTSTREGDYNEIRTNTKSEKQPTLDTFAGCVAASV